MTVKDQVNILDRKIKQNKADYDLYRQNAEISALSSGDLNKYEYLTNKASPIQKAKFEYSPLGQVFNKGLDSNERQEGLLKRLKNIEDNTDGLRVIESQKNDQSGLKSIGFDFKKIFHQKDLRPMMKLLKRKTQLIILIFTSLHETLL